MNKRLKTLKLLPVYCAISAVIIIAGIILYALLGFNYGMEKPVHKTFEVSYNVVAEIGEFEDAIQDSCETAFKANKLGGYEKVVKNEVGGSYSTETGNKALVYTFGADADDDALRACQMSVEHFFEDTKYADAEASVSVHEIANERFTVNLWRAAVAIAVASVVVLVYIGIRFGAGIALTGLVGCVNGVFMTLGIFAVARIPVFAAGPVLYAAIAAFATLLAWMLHAIKMRENFKDPSYANFTAAEAVAESLKTSEKSVFITLMSIAVIAIVFGAIATAGVRMLVVLTVIPVAAAMYSATFLMPALHVPIKKAFDKFKASKKRQYIGRKKEKKAEDAK